MLCYHSPKESTVRRCAFYTVGVVTDTSSLLTPSALGDSGNYYTKSINLSPLNIEWERMISMAQSIFDDNQDRVFAYKGGVSFSTRPEPRGGNGARLLFAKLSAY